MLTKQELEDVEKQINNQVGDIRVRGLLKTRKETLKDFIKQFLTKWNNEHETIFVKTEQIQTQEGARRSLGDIYRICKYYYPKCTLKEVANILYNEAPTDFPHFRSSYCHTINKRVFYVDLEDTSEIYDKLKHDEYGKPWREWAND